MPLQKRAEKRKMRPKMSIRRGDEIVVIAGREKGKRGNVTRVFPEKNRVIVEGVNLVKRHLRRQPGSLQAGIIDMPAPLSRSNVMLICTSCGEPTRVGHTILPDGSHVRMCKKCHEIIQVREQ